MTQILDFPKVCKKMAHILELSQVCKITHNLDLPKVSNIYIYIYIYKKFFVHNIKIVNLSFNELKLIAKFRGIKGYKIMS